MAAKYLESYLEHSVKQIKSELSPYCLSSCNDSCCDFTRPDIRLFVTKETLELLIKDHDWIKQLIIEGKIEPRDERFKLISMACPAYDSETKKCSIYHDSRRPSACLEFPISVENDEDTAKLWVFMDSRCSYLRDNWEQIVQRWEADNKDLYGQVVIRISAWFGTLGGFSYRYVDQTNKDDVRRMILEAVQYDQEVREAWGIIRTKKHF